MELLQVGSDGRVYIETYGIEGFSVAGHLWTESILLLPHDVSAWSVNGVSDLTLDCFDKVLSSSPRAEIFLLGCGTEGSMVSQSLMDGLKSRGLVLESMNTGAACRTYNLLVSENRRVAAGLMPITS